MTMHTEGVFTTAVPTTAVPARARVQRCSARGGSLVLLLTLSLASSASARQAAADDDAAALALPGAEAAVMPTHPATSGSFEGAWTSAARRGGETAEAERLSAEVAADERLSPDLRFVFGDRLDLDWAGAWAQSEQTNTLKQAYLSWQPESSLLLDAGRINVRQGVAYGYNPTDFLRADAVRAIDSLDPNSLRDERLGTAMVRGEDLWTSGALTALYAPRLATSPSAAPFSPDWGATNGTSRWMVSLSQALGSHLTPQWLLFGTDRVQAGVDLTTLIGSSVVAYLEASGGRIPSLWEQALGLPPHADWRERAATGFTVTTADKLSLTLEYEYDGAALGRSAWTAARAGSLNAYGVYRNFVLTQQELPTQQAVFVYATWQDLILRHLDATALLRVDVLDHSRLPWTELRYHWSKVEAALRWQAYSGGSTTDFGASSTSRSWQVVLDYFY